MFAVTPTLQSGALRLGRSQCPLGLSRAVCDANATLTYQDRMALVLFGQEGGSH